MKDRRFYMLLLVSLFKSAWGRIEVVHELVQHGADCSLLNNKGWSVFDYCYSSMMLKYIQALSVGQKKGTSGMGFDDAHK